MVKLRNAKTFENRHKHNLIGTTPRKCRKRNGRNGKFATRFTYFFSSGGCAFDISRKYLSFRNDQRQKSGLNQVNGTIFCKYTMPLCTAAEDIQCKYVLSVSVTALNGCSAATTTMMMMMMMLRCRQHRAANENTTFIDWRFEGEFQFLFLFTFCLSQLLNICIFIKWLRLLCM